MSEPTVVRATVREGDDEWHIECRMSDGQKGAFVVVDHEFEQLAHRIAMFLNGEPVGLCGAETRDISVTGRLGPSDRELRGEVNP